MYISQTDNLPSSESLILIDIAKYCHGKIDFRNRLDGDREDSIFSIALHFFFRYKSLFKIKFRRGPLWIIWNPWLNSNVHERCANWILPQIARQFQIDFLVLSSHLEGKINFTMLGKVQKKNRKSWIKQKCSQYGWLIVAN